ncbi:MAG: DUF4350 domain-containing protein [Novosphingobium sp.]|nr:DUF4350 domain-containing protein [Novosphingobium sp.]
MTGTAASDAGAGPFSPRAVLVLVLFGAAVFVALLWMIGTGYGTGSANDGGNHAGGKGLNGFAAFAAYLDKRGYAVRNSRSEAVLDDPGLLVLTPPHVTDGKELDRIVGHRHLIGPTMVILPKWIASGVPQGTPGAKKGWVRLSGARPPIWKGFRDDVSVSVGPLDKGDKAARWTGAGLEGKLPVAEKVQAGSGAKLVPLVVGKRDGRILAAYVDDGGSYPLLEQMALRPRGDSRTRRRYFPLVMVFEPDLLDNYGMARAANARLGERLVQAAGYGAADGVNFDLTLNGHGRSPNLLTLAFTPPFLAATLCLLMAALAVGWRAFLRFGPARKPVRAIAFGKRALVANSAGLIRRARRLHLIAAPYARRARERLAAALGLPRLADPAETEAALDRAIAARLPDSAPFSAISARLAAARKPHDILRAAQDLHALERTLQR